MLDNWIKLLLDSPYFTSGERVSGEVHCIASKNSKIILKSSGDEKLQIITPDGQEKKHSLKVYNIYQELGEAQEQLQLVFPFTFKIPQYIPASFEYKDRGDDGTEYDISISYSLEVFIENDSNLISRDFSVFTILNKLSRLTLPSVSDFTQVLHSCCCVPRGVCKFLIEPINFQHVTCTDKIKFNIQVLSESNSQLVSLIIHLVLDVSFRLPSQNSFFVTNIVHREVPDIEELRKNSESPDCFQLFFEVNLGKELKNNACSNEAGLFKSDFKLKVMANYDIGIRSKIAECEMLLQINPKPVDEVIVNFPENWRPNENRVKSLLASIDLDLDKSD